MTERELEVWLSDWFRREGVSVGEDDTFVADSAASSCSECGEFIWDAGVAVVLGRLAVDLRDELGLAK